MPLTVLGESVLSKGTICPVLPGGLDTDKYLNSIILEVSALALPLLYMPYANILADGFAGRSSSCLMPPWACDLTRQSTGADCHKRPGPAAHGE